jgi:peptidoglycan/xylan/chitin deacetylase (PgdA/CDA1 family)
MKGNMMRVTSVARKATKALALPIGVGSARRDGDLVILLFHRVGVGAREIDLPITMFEHHIAELAMRHRIRSLDDVLRTGRGGVVLTFDDGFRDFHEQVLPVLEQHRVPAVLYLATGFVANGEASTAASREQLTWSQLEEAVATGLVTVGSHSHSHVSLARATEREAEEEMRRSKEMIEGRLGVTCRHFAYPFCVSSRDADLAARRLFDTAATDAWRTNRQGRIDPYQLGRTPVLRSDGTFFFRAKARGQLDGERLVYRALRRGPWRTP